MKGAIAWFADNHVAANLLMMFMIVAGVVTGMNMKLEVFPETSLDVITITVAYTGASPAEVEEAVIRRIEEKIAGLNGIKRIDSTAREGVAAINIEVVKDWDLKQLLDEVKAEVDRITTLPLEAEKPVVREVTRRSQVINLAVYGDAPEATIKHLAEKIKDELTNLPGITQADLSAVRTSEVHIEIGEETLRRFGLTLEMVAQAVARASLDLPAGSVKTAAGEILVRTKGRRYRAVDYEDIPIIMRPDGSEITLDQIADIREGYADIDLFARFQGKPAAMINVYQVADQNALKIAATVKAYIEKTRPSLPAGVDIGCYGDMSKVLNSRIQLLTRNMMMGLVLVIVSLGLFLNLRLAFWVTLGIPISFAASMMLLPQMDVSINMISLFAFIMVLGIVVDDAIVVGENVYRLQEEGLSPVRAATDGAIGVGMPVIFSVLTTMAAFWPLLMAGGMMGKIMRNIPIVVIAVLFASLTESLLILPSHLARSRDAGREHREKIASRALKWFIRGPYARLLRFALRWRYVTVAVGIAILLFTVGIWRAGWIKFTFFPKVEGDVLQCMISMPVGTPASQTQEVVNRIEGTVRKLLAQQDEKRGAGKDPLLEYSISLIGAQFGRHASADDTGAHLAQVWVQLLDGEKRDVSSMALANLWREAVGPVPEAESVTFKSELHSAGNAIEVHLSLDDHGGLIEAAQDLKKSLAGYEGVFDISDSFVPGKKEMQLKLKPSAAQLGLNLDNLARQVRHALYGAEALRFQRDKDEVKVLVRYPEKERRSLGNIENMRIRTPAGEEVPFSQVAEVTMEQGYASIERAQRLRVIKVLADVDEKRSNADEIREDLVKRYLPTLKTNHPDLRYTIEGEGKEKKESLADVRSGFIIALFCIYALLAVPFKSFSQPLIVMSAIPFGIVGAVWGHLIMGFNISIISLFGIVGLTGVVVNDSLVLIDQVNQIRLKGFSAQEAVAQSAAIRFRAIILTSLTTFAGLTPMLMEQSIQAQFLIPMAVSLGFGVMFATAITLILIPCGYLILEDLIGVVRRLWPGPVGMKTGR